MEIKKFFNRVKELISKLDVTEEDLRDDIEKEPVEESIFDQVKSFNLKKYEKEKFLGEKRDYVEDFKKYYKYGISGGTFIESILSVALDGRKASCCFQDQFFENPAGFQSIQQVETIAKEMKKDYNIFMDLVGIPMDKGCMILIFFFKDIKTYEKLKKLQTDIENIKK